MEAVLQKKLFTDVLSPTGAYAARVFLNPALSRTLARLPSLMDFNRREVQQVELAGGNAQATARGLATLYSAVERAVSTRGDENMLGLAKESLEELSSPAKPSPKTGWLDEVSGMEMALSRGFRKPVPEEDATIGRYCSFGCDDRAFGVRGSGGSFGFCDPASELAFAYTTNRCSEFPCDDHREFALRMKTYESIQHLRSAEGKSSLPMERLRMRHNFAAREVMKVPQLASTLS